jgi:hypothetical protein
MANLVSRGYNTNQPKSYSFGFGFSKLSKRPRKADHLFILLINYKCTFCPSRSQIEFQLVSRGVRYYQKHISCLGSFFNKKERKEKKGRRPASVAHILWRQRWGELQFEASQGKE